MNINRHPNPDAICRESWWICDRATFTETRLKREPTLKAAYGSMPVASVSVRAERSFMDGVKGKTERVA